MGSYNKRISDQSKIKFDPINRELIDSENSELDARVESLEENITGSKTATGNPLTVTDAAPVNAVNLSMDLEPIQAGSGTPSPDNIRPISGRSEVAIDRVGKNLFDGLYPNIDSTIQYKGVYVGDGEFTLETTTPHLDVDGACVLFLLAGNVDTGAGNDTNGVYNEQSRTVTALNGYVTIAYRVYENINPVNYETILYKTTDKQTYTIQLGQTVYGGHLDVTKGKMVVDSGYIASYNGETLPSTWISDRDVYASETSPTTGAQVVYELATPYSIDLTPQQIKLLENTNTITTDYDGDVLSLEYQPNNAFGELLGEVNNIYDSIIENIYDKIDSLDTRVTALEE